MSISGETVVVPRQGKNPTTIGTDGTSQVVLYNDHVNTFEHVIKTLMQVFGHPHAVAMKLAWDAHNSGRTVAEVESHEDAVQHKGQLISAGLTAEVEKV